jgi:hypothetical protein
MPRRAACWRLRKCATRRAFERRRQDGAWAAGSASFRQFAGAQKPKRKRT